MSSKKIAFVVDSSIGIYGEEIKKQNLYQVFFGVIDSTGKVYQDDNTELNTETIFKKYDEGLSFQTSAVAPGPVMALLEELYEKYEQVILFTVSSGLSSYHDNIKFLEEEYKGKLHIVDTKEVGIATQTMVKDARKMLDDGVDLQEVLTYCRNFYLNDFTYFCCKSWTPLVRGGRAPKALSKIFNFFNTRPVISFYVKNKLAGISTSFKKSVEKMISAFKKIFNNPTADEINYIVFYNNKVEEENAKFIRQRIFDEFKIPQEKYIETYVPNLVLIYTANESYGLHIRCNKPGDNKYRKEED